MSDTLDQTGADRDRRWRLPFTWLGLLAICFVIYELTHNPALGAVAICLKFGWEDFATARWLFINDPDPWRRRATFWVYLAWGLWKIALVACLMTTGFVLVNPLNRAAPGAPMALVWAFAGTVLTALAGFLLSALMTAIGVGIAWCGGVRLWLDTGVHRARRWNRWPPAAVCAGRDNRLEQLLLTALMIGGFAILAGVVAGVNRLGNVAGPLVCGLLAIAAPVAFALGRNAVARAVRASSPYECWWEGALDSGGVDSLASPPRPGVE
jgi:hypothetical protein